ncbi:MAG: methyl-accepting chemotaxis protein [Planctomycetaceae bacterium]|jgi:methyl-accepting chemotaxis protein|nr:methyl-accepting chemotaxis protein [Planctomycetaceae bacterium]
MGSFRRLINRWKIGTKLYAGFGFLTLLIIAVSLVGLIGSRILQHGTQIIQYYGAISDNGNQAIIDGLAAEITVGKHFYLSDSAAAVKTAEIFDRVRKNLEKIENDIADDPYHFADSHPGFREKAVEAKKIIDDYAVINEQYSEWQTVREAKNNKFNAGYAQCSALLGDILKLIDDSFREQISAASGGGSIPMLYFQKNKAARDCRGALTAFKVAYDAYLLAVSEADGAKKYGTALAACDKFNETTQIFSALPWEDSQQPSLRQIIQYAGTLRKDFLEVADAINKQHKLVTAKEEKETLFGQQTGALMNEVQTIYAEAETMVLETSHRILMEMGILALVTLLAALLTAWGTTRNIVPGIRQIDHAMKEITKTGDLTVTIEPQYRERADEIGDLAAAFALFVEELRSVEHLAVELAGGNWQVSVKSRGELDSMNIHINMMLEKVNQTLGAAKELVGQVALGAAEIASASGNLSQGASESAASLEEINASMHEIGGQTNQNAQNAGEADKMARSAHQAAGNGQTMMRKMIEAMSLITKNSQEVQNVVKVIDDISFQTNLLALNAAVEAARAGAHGKGFAVVAEEVRNLASRSAKAAAETTQMIENNSRQINEGAGIAAETAEMLNGIVEESQKVASLLADIAKASNEQALGISQVSQGLSQIDTVVQQNTASAEETASVSGEMSGQAGELQQLVGQFKLRSREN